MKNIDQQIEVRSRRSAREIATRVAGTAAAVAGLAIVGATTMDAKDGMFDTPVASVAHEAPVESGVMTILGGSVVTLGGLYFALRQQ